MKRTIFIIALMALGVSSCQITDENDLHVNKGTAKFAVDESFKYIAIAQSNAYMMHYPETDFEITFTPEQNAVNLLLSDSVEVIMTSRHLTEEEQQYFVQRNMKYLPGNMAMDAVVLIVNKESELSTISEQEVNNLLTGKSENNFKLVFDNSNSSNLNLLKEKYNIENFDNTSVFSAKGTDNLIEIIQNRPNTIGVIGLNWLSDSNDKRVQKLRSKVKMLNIETIGGEQKEPSLINLRDNSYPFARTIYVITNQDRWGVAKGFVRFACTQIGQLVVEKMDLQPFTLIPKKYNMTPSAPLTVVE